MKYVKISKDIKEAFIKFNEEFLKEDGSVTPFAAALGDYSFDEFVEVSENYEKGILPDPAHVPGTTFYLMDKEKIVGAINIRHSLNDYLLKFGGHIGYGVVKSERGKGYAKKMLNFGIEFLKELGEERALLTCDKTNPASARVILACGGEFENEIESDRRITQRYWINIKK